MSEKVMKWYLNEKMKENMDEFIAASTKGGDAMNDLMMGWITKDCRTAFLEFVNKFNQSYEEEHGKK